MTYPAPVQQPPEQIDTDELGLVCHSLHTTSFPKYPNVPVVGNSTTYRNIFVKVIRPKAGDVLDVYADIKVTNDAGRWTTKGNRYTVGAGFHLWWYNATITPPEARAATWQLIGDTAGKNVTVDEHHAVLGLSRVLRVPDDWVDGEAVGIVLRVAAMSTSWTLNSPTGGDTLTVDPDGILKVTRWSTPPAPPQEGP